MRVTGPVVAGLVLRGSVGAHLERRDVRLTVTKKEFTCGERDGFEIVKKHSPSMRLFVTCTLTPPKKTLDLTSGRYLLKRSYSFWIWKASSRVWQSTTTWHSPATGDSWCKVASTKTAVLPMPVAAGQWKWTTMDKGDVRTWDGAAALTGQDAAISRVGVYVMFGVHVHMHVPDLA